VQAIQQTINVERRNFNEIDNTSALSRDA